MTATSLPTDRLTIVTPTYEKHFRQFGYLLQSICDNCLDPEKVTLYVIVEEHNRAMFQQLCEQTTLAFKIIATEDILHDFRIDETPVEFLRRVGKFTFQTVKKFGGLSAATTQWSLVLDSEGLFVKPFQAAALLDDYASQKYVFYTRTGPRGDIWRHSTGYQVTKNAGAALQAAAGDRWYMEYFHWFYETDKVLDLLTNKLDISFFDALRDKTRPTGDFFENIIYYLYLEKYHNSEYDFIDFKELLQNLLPPELSARFKLSELPFSLFGNEYLLNILGPTDVPALAGLFERFKLPFVRLEPPYFSPDYLTELKKLPHFVATISSHHMIWMKKKIAVCISGEFRHFIHRTPEHHVRQILGFLAGVGCDIYIHGWSNSSEALIIDQLKPRAYKFEPYQSFSSIESAIELREPNIKPGRDAGSLAMFYGIESAFRLAEENIDEYDVIVRLRPDIYFDGSLKEILVAISDEGDFLPNTIYFPKHFHSKGINDQFAIGPCRQMSVYAHTFSYIKENVSHLFFNPETILLRNILEHNVDIAVVEMRYALMRHDPIRIDSMHHHLHEQERVWWSRSDPLPSYVNLSAYFSDKLRSMNSIMRQDIDRLTFLDTRTAARHGAVIRCAVIDNDPALSVSAFFDKGQVMSVLPLVLQNGEVVEEKWSPPNQVFLFPFENGLRLSQWLYRDGRLRNETLDVPLERVRSGKSPHPIRMRLASEWRQFVQKNHLQRFARTLHHVGRAVGFRR